MSQLFALETRLDHENRRPLVWLALLAALLAVQISARWFPTPDATAYLSIARSIATRHQLRMLGYAYIPYPPGYPLLLSPAFLLGPLPFLAISILQWLMAIVFMVGLYQWMKRQAPAAALLLTALVMVNVTFWIYYRRTLSELAFMTVAIWAVLLLDSALADRIPWRRITKVLCGAVLLVFLALIREIGVLFATALVIAAGLGWYRGSLKIATALWVVALVFVPTLAAAAGFVIYDQLSFSQVHVFGTHLSGLFDARIPLGHRLIDGVRLQICAVGRLTVPGMFKSYGHRWLNINLPVYAAVFAALAWGWWRWVRRQAEVFALVLPLYLIVYAVWDFDADTRYLLPVLPVLLVALWYLVERWRSYRLALLAGLLVANFAVSVGYWTLVERPRLRDCNRRWSEVVSLAGELDKRPGEISAVDGVPRCLRLMLSLKLDRPIQDLRLHPQALAGAQWLLAPADQAPAAGFRTATVDGAYALWLRAPPVASR